MFIKKFVIRAVQFCILILIVAFSYPMGYFLLNDSYPVPYSENNSIKHGIKSYVINLDRSKSRYEYVKPAVTALGFPVERVSGIDGNLLSLEEMNLKVDWFAWKQIEGAPPLLGAVGCALSHIKAWKTFLESDAEYGIFFEDDVSFNSLELRQTIDQILQNNKLWDVVTLYTEGTPLTLKKLNKDQKLVVYPRQVIFAVAYIMNRHAARQLLSKSMPLKMPIDWFFTRGWELNLRFTGIEPIIVKHSFDDSVIGTSKGISKDRNPKMYFKRMRHAVIMMQSNVMRFLYNFKIYILYKLGLL